MHIEEVFLTFGRTIQIPKSLHVLAVALEVVPAGQILAMALLLRGRLLAY